VKRWSLWRAALYGALASLAISWVAIPENQSFWIGANRAENVAGLVGMAIPGVILFVMFAQIRNHFRKQK
jgi:uncharacterized membrane protein YagU involved in acid resistance